MVTTIYELPIEDQVCPACGNPLHKMTEKVHVEIEVIPAKVQVHKHVTYVYSCRACEEKEHAVIINAPRAPAIVIEKSTAGASLIADSMTPKSGS